jgi:serine/threonine-protein kinase/endoribonuclease IRE1
LYVTPLHDNSILTWSSDGGKKPARWVGHLDSVAVNVFDVLKSSIDSEDPLMILPHPSYFQSQNKDPRLLSSAYIQRISDDQWFAMSGQNSPALVLNAPDAPWLQSDLTSFSSKKDYYDSLVGVHYNLGKPGNFPTSPEIPGELLVDEPTRGMIEAPNGKHFPIPYYHGDDSSHEISRPPPPNYISPPDDPHSSSLSRILNSALRVLENAIAFLIFFVFLLAAIKTGWVPQLAGILELTEKLKLQPSNDDKFVTDEKMVMVTGKHVAQSDVPEETPTQSGSPKKSTELTNNDIQDGNHENLSPKYPNLSVDEDGSPNSASKKVGFEEDAKPLLPDVSNPTSPVTPKKRKRGTRGGKKNNAKKKDKETAGTTVVEEKEDVLQQAVSVVNDANIKTFQNTSELNPTQMSLLDVSKEVLGYGSHGTVVLKGVFEKREVAVKRMLLDFYEVASQEVTLLQESDDHPNVIRYYCKQASDRFLYIALELCPGTLEDLIEKPDRFRDLSNSLTSSQVMFQIASGVQHLHYLKIVHRDLKPQNILVAPPKVLHKKDPNMKHSQEVLGPARMLISDFGLCKKLEGDQSSFRATTAHAAGTSGWRAPELLIDEGDSLYNHTNNNSENSEPLVIDTLSNRRATRAIDIFSMGCVFYYILSNGQHPFGDKYMREANIVQGTYSLDYLDEYQMADAVEAKYLISRMISRDPRQRPDATDVLLHPLFWSPERRLDFLLKVSDRFEVEPRDPPSALLNLLEADAAKVVGPDWHSKLDKGFVENLGKYRKYHGNKIMDLLRAMRNKSHHFNDLPAKVRVNMEPYPEGYLTYFTKRFPFLLMVIYYVVKDNLAAEPMFKSFFVES